MRFLTTKSTNKKIASQQKLKQLTRAIYKIEAMEINPKVAGKKVKTKATKSLPSPGVFFTSLILGTLTSIAIQNYFNQLVQTRQNKINVMILLVTTETREFNTDYSNYQLIRRNSNSLSAITRESGNALRTESFQH